MANTGTNFSLTPTEALTNYCHQHLFVKSVLGVVKHGLAVCVVSKTLGHQKKDQLQTKINQNVYSCYGRMGFVKTMWVKWSLDGLNYRPSSCSWLGLQLLLLSLPAVRCTSCKQRWTAVTYGLWCFCWNKHWPWVGQVRPTFERDILNYHLKSCFSRSSFSWRGWTALWVLLSTGTSSSQ